METAAAPGETTVDVAGARARRSLRDRLVLDVISGVLVAAAASFACTGPPTPASEQAVRALWEEYLASKQGRFSINAGTPSLQWSPSEQERWPIYDLAGYFLPHGVVPEVVSATPLNPAADTAYRIVTRFHRADGATADSSGAPAMTMTVYARRERRRWVLASALPYNTRSWARETRGRISYFIAPTLQFNPARAELAAAFVDSLVGAFGLAAPPPIEYFVTESVDQAMEILGAVVPERFGPNGGFARTNMVFSGIPALGENYRHELTHVLLGPLMQDGTSSLLASEGVPTWLGGSGERDFTESVRHLAALLGDQPTVDLHRIVFDQGISSEIRNPAGAVLAQMAFEAGGTEAVLSYLRSPGHALPETLERLLGRPWETILADWRRRVAEIAAS